MMDKAERIETLTRAGELAAAGVKWRAISTLAERAEMCRTAAKFFDMADREAQDETHTVAALREA